MDVCSRLWCAVVRQGQMVCLTKKLPAVEGTPCGKGRICLQGKCVDKTKKKYYSVSYQLWLSGTLEGVILKEGVKGTLLWKSDWKLLYFFACNWSVTGGGNRKNATEFQEACFLLEVWKPTVLENWEHHFRLEDTHSVRQVSGCMERLSRNDSQLPDFLAIDSEANRYENLVYGPHLKVSRELTPVKRKIDEVHPGYNV